MNVNDHNTATGVSRRTLVKGAAWSLPVVAAAVATPLAAASPELAALTFSVAPIVDVYAPYGATSITVTNNSTVDYVGPITFTTPAWATVAPFALTGAIRTTDGTNTVWTLPAATISAGKSLVLDLTWAGPNPPAAETQPLTVTVDPALGTATPAGTTTIDSPYALLWYAVTPGGQGNLAGTTSWFLGNTTDTAYTGTGTMSMEVWGFPQPSVARISNNGTTYTGVRTAQNGKFVGLYSNLALDVPATSGRQVFTFAWPTLANQTLPQQDSQIWGMFNTAPETTFAPLGSELVYSNYHA